MEPEDRYLQGVPNYKKGIEMEEWRDVVGYENYFKVSNKGNIFSKRSNKVLKLCTQKSGYVLFTTRLEGRNGKSLCFKVHRLVAEAFIANPENKPAVNHLDSNKTNNHVENLEWCTYKENAQHCVKMGGYPCRFGANNSSVKLTEQDVLFIRENYTPRHKEFGSRALGKRFGVSHTTISAVVNNISWINT